MYVLDSSALIELIRNLPRASKILDFLRDAPVETTSIVLHELLSGIPTEKQRLLLDDLLMDATIIPHDADAAHASASIQRTLNAAGMNIGMRDILIAGTCKAKNATLVTLDKDFARIKDLNVQVIS